MTFRVGDGEPDRLFPLDLVPRIITADDWAGLSAGLTQRVRALEAFLRDVYGPRQIIADGVMPAAVIDEAPGWSRLGTLTPADAVRIAVAGIDLVRDRADHWLVLEDNLRVPSGIGYAITSRRLIRSVMPDLEPPAGVVGLEGVAGLLRGLEDLLDAAVVLGIPPRVQQGADGGELEDVLQGQCDLRSHHVAKRKVQDGIFRRHSALAHIRLSRPVG